MENYLLILLLSVMVIGNISFFYYWWHAHHYLNERNYCTFTYRLFFMFNKYNFKPEGNKYRKKAIGSLVVTIGVIVFMASLYAK